jgi:hypothetical protein
MHKLNTNILNNNSLTYFFHRNIFDNTQNLSDLSRNPSDITQNIAESIPKRHIPLSVTPYGSGNTPDMIGTFLQSMINNRL